MTLSPGQQRVFQGIIEGRSNQDIASQLGLCEKTVKAHVTDILKKAKLRSRCELIVAFYTGKLREVTCAVPSI
jgi:DNA-binding NarL/FixJ family response regulator